MKYTFVLLLFSAQLTAQIPTDGLVACYNFNTDASDPIGLFNGSLVGGATTNGELLIGANNSDALFIPGEVLSNVSEFTISCYVTFEEFNTNHASASNVIFSGASASNDNLLNFGYAKNQLQGGSATLINTFFAIQDGVRYDFSDIILESNETYHVVLTRDSTDFRLFVNNEEQGIPGGQSAPVSDFSIDPIGFVFGQDQDILGGGFEEFQALNGRLDDLLIYDRNLNEIEVAEIFTSEHEVLSISQVDQIQYNYYPNPSSSFIRIDMPISTGWTVQLNNCEGRKIYQSAFFGESTLLDVGHFAKGSYVLTVSDGTTATSNLVVFD